MQPFPALFPGIVKQSDAYHDSKAEVKRMTPEEMEKFLNDRQNSGEEALMEELRRMTREQERSGEMSPIRMEEIYSTLSPFLSERQREKMREVIRRLKE